MRVSNLSALENRRRRLWQSIFSRKKRYRYSYDSQLVLKFGLEKLYAMKILNKAKLDHVYHKMHTISERQILQNVNSPFVVKLHAAFQNPKNLYLVLEYLPGGNNPLPFLFPHIFL